MSQKHNKSHGLKADFYSLSYTIFTIKQYNRVKIYNLPELGLH